ncbi:MAG: ribonuclease Z [Syntrophobacteraceae bacterium]|nr:ribonuclease Z [Syntrophobacteraceae bacterium]
MKITFIGVGEAFDEELSNTSIEISIEESGVKNSILFDCGLTVPPCYWKSLPDADRLDAIWISHFHGDHFFGLPALLTRFRQMNRKKPLVILGQQDAAGIIRQTLELAYPAILDKLGYQLRFVAVEPGEVVNEAGLVWQSALNAHSVRNLAVRIQKGSKSVFYSGDGLSTAETLSLAQGADLVIHEAFRIEQEFPGHSTVSSCVSFARRANVCRLALVHVERNERRLRREDILQMIAKISDFDIFLPEPGDWLEI